MSEDTLRRWSDAGKIASSRHPTSKHRLFRVTDVEEKRRELESFSEDMTLGEALKRRITPLVESSQRPAPQPGMTVREAEEHGISPLLESTKGRPA